MHVGNIFELNTLISAAKIRQEAIEEYGERLGISLVHLPLLDSRTLIFLSEAVFLHDNLNLPRLQIIIVNFERLSE